VECLKQYGDDLWGSHFARQNVQTVHPVCAPIYGQLDKLEKLRCQIVRFRGLESNSKQDYYFERPSRFFRLGAEKKKINNILSAEPDIMGTDKPSCEM